jgi:hypothetical protein
MPGRMAGGCEGALTCPALCAACCRRPRPRRRPARPGWKPRARLRGPVGVQHPRARVLAGGACSFSSKQGRQEGQRFSSLSRLPSRCAGACLPAESSESSVALSHDAPLVLQASPRPRRRRRQASPRPRRRRRGTRRRPKQTARRRSRGRLQPTTTS